MPLSDLDYLMDDQAPAPAGGSDWRRATRYDLDYLMDDEPEAGSEYQRDPVAQQAVESLSVTADMDPDTEAKRRQLARDTGVPLPLVREQEAAVRKQAEAPDIQQLWSEAQRTMEYLADPDNAAVARDDTKNLSLIERIVKKMQSYKDFSLIKPPGWAEKPVAESIRLGEVMAQASAVTEHNIKLARVNYQRAKLALTNPGAIDMNLETEARKLERAMPPEYQYRNLRERTVTSVGSMFPYILHQGFASQKGGAVGSLIGAAIGGTGAVIGGSFGPQAALPEETVTVPAAIRAGAKLGYRYGATAGGTRDMFITEAGSAYADFEKITDIYGRPIDRRIVAAAALAYGMGAAPLEHYGLKNIPGGEYLLGRFSKTAVRRALNNPATRNALRNVVLKWGRGVGTETLTEVAQEALQVLAGEAAKSASALADENRVYTGEGLGELVTPETMARFSEVALDTALATAVIGLPGATISGLSDAARADAARSHAEDMQALFDAVENGKLKARSADIAQSHLLAVGGGDDVFIAPEFFQTDTDTEAAAAMAERLGLDPAEALAEAYDGRDVRVPYAAVMARLQPDEYERIKPDLKASPGAMSLREAEAYDKAEAKAALGERYERIAREVAPVTAETARIRKEAEAAGYAKPVVNDIMRGLLSRFTAAHPDPAGFLGRIHIAGGQIFIRPEAPFTQGQVYNQAGRINTDTPAFKNWFKQSKVVDSVGAPREVYHGTEFEGIRAFEPNEQGLIYLSTSPETAASYGGELMPLYVSMQNPLVIDAEGQSFKDVIPSAYVERAKAEGHDGVIVQNIRDDAGYQHEGDTIVTWRPEQIKSVSNRGTWSSADADIYNQTAKLPDPAMAQGLMRDTETGETVFNIEEAARAVAEQEKTYYQGIETPEGGRLMRGAEGKTGPLAQDVVAGAITDDILDEYDQVASVDEARQWAEQSKYLDPVVLADRQKTRWNRKKGLFGNKKMIFSSVAYPGGRNTYDYPGCGRMAWADKNALDMLAACYDGACYAEVFARIYKKSIAESIDTQPLRIKSIREKIEKYYKRNGLEKTQERFPALVINEKDGGLSIAIVKQYLSGARVSKNLARADGVDIRLGVDTDGSAWLANRQVMDALLAANPRSLSVFSSAYHAPPPPHALSGRTIINVTVSGWHPLPETLHRLKWAEAARANGWNVILREVVADEEAFGKETAARYNRLHEALMQTDFFIMQQGLHKGKKKSKPQWGLPTCCNGSRKNPGTCDQCEVNEGLGREFAKYWKIQEEDVREEQILPDVTPARIARYTQAWDPGFPEAVTHGVVKIKPTQDKKTADEVVRKAIDPGRIKALAAAHPNAILAPVLGDSMVPAAYANAVKDISGLEYTTDIIQANKEGHAGKTAFQRLFLPMDYVGHVIPDQEYILATDTLTSGGAVNDLRLYIESKGGRVVSITALSGTRGIAAKPETIAALERKHDRKELENILAEYGAPGDIESLTQPQIRYLAQFTTLDRLRDRIAKEKISRRDEIQRGLFQRPGLSPADDKTFYQLDVQPPAPPFYSQLIQTIESDKFPNRAPPALMTQVIESWVKKGLLKEEEVQWSGVVEWLKTREDQIKQDKWVWKKAQKVGTDLLPDMRRPADKITKAEVLEYLRANAVKVEEVRTGPDTIDETSRQEIAYYEAELDAAADQYVREMKEYERILTEGGVEQVTALRMIKAMGREWNTDETATAEAFKKAHEVDRGYDWDRLYDFYQEVKKAENDLAEAKEFARYEDPKFEKYTLEGGEKYRELLLTLPTPSLSTMGREAYNKAIAEQEKRGGAYLSAHWDTPNVLAHVRFNERTGPNGERILFIEEIQSDWHQAGRKKGYFAPEFVYQAYIERPDGYPVVVGHGKTGREALDDAINYLGISGTSRTKKSDLKLRRVEKKPEKPMAPDAPFKKSWPMLVVKRMVRWAAENGFDELAWTPGEVQVERYDLSKEVSSIESVGRGDVATGEKSRSVTINLKGTPSYIELGMDNEGNIDNATRAEFKDKHLSDVLGQEMADRILSGPVTAEYSGAGLKVGGEGMKAFYDEILPAEIRKFFGKKIWGSPKVDKTIIKADNAPEDVVERWAQQDPEHPLVKKNRMQVWALPITPEMKEKALGQGMPLFQDEESPKPRGSVRVANGQYLISLFKGDQPGQGANLSTLMHELGHVFFLEMESLVQAGQADEQLATDFETLRGWIGLAPGQTAKREDHEKWARGFEAYLAEGKAPDPALEGVFFRFKQWLSHVYESVQQILGPDLELNDDVRRVFDRMLGDRRQVEAAAYEAGMTMPTTAQMEALGIVAEDRQYMRRLLKQARDAAERNMTANRDAGLKETTDALRRRAVKDIKQDPVRLQASAIRKSGGLDRGILLEMYGPETLGKLPAGLTRNKGGLDPDMAANMPAVSGPGLGPLFTSADDMINRLSRLQPLEDAVNTRFNELMAAHDARHAAVDYLLETEEYAAFLEILAKYEGRGRVKTAPRAQFKAYAKNTLDAMAVADAVRHDRFMAYMRKHQRMEAEKAADGKLDEAAAANELVRLNFEMAGLAVKNRREMEAAERRIKKALRSKSIDTDFRTNLHILAHRFGLTKKPPAPEFLARASSLESLLTDESGLIDNSGAFAEWLVGGSYTTSYKKLTMTQLRELADLTAFLEKMGRQKKAPTLSDGTLVADAVSDSMAETSGLKQRKVHRRGGTREALQKLWNGYQGMSESIPFLVIELGGYRNVGPSGVKSYTEKVLADPLTDAVRAETVLFRKIWEQARPHVDTIHAGIRRLQKAHGARIVAAGAEVPAALRHAGQDGWWAPDQIFAVVHNLGNQDNIDRLKDGYGLTENDLAALTAMLTEEEVLAIQGLWDTYNSLYDRINDVHMQMKGYPMSRVQALPRVVTVKGGKQVTLPGGYAPIRYDRTLNTPGSLQVARFSEREELMAQAEAVYQVPATKSGFTMVRKKSVKLPLRLTMDIAAEHLRDTVHYITHAAAVRDVQKVLFNTEYGAHVAGFLNPASYEAMAMGLRHIAQPAAGEQDWFSRKLNWVSPLVTAYTLGWNFSVMLKQWFSSPAAMVDIGPVAYLEGQMYMFGLKDYIQGTDIIMQRGWYGKYHQILEMSPKMRARAEAVDADLRRKVEGMRFNQTVWGRLNQFFAFDIAGKEYSIKTLQESVFILIRMMDALTVMPIWHGSLKKGLRMFDGDLEKAIKFADDIVDRTQPSGSAEQLTQWQRSKVAKYFIRFVSFTVGKYIQRRRVHFRAMRQGQLSVPLYAWHTFLEAILPPVLMKMMFALFQGDPMPWEDDDEGNPAIYDYALNTLAYWFATGRPLVQDLVGAFSAPLETPISTAGKIAKRNAVGLFNAVEEGLDEEAFKKMAWNAWEFFSLVSRMPFSRVQAKAEKGIAQEKDKYLSDTPIKYVIPAYK